MTERRYGWSSLLGAAEVPYLRSSMPRVLGRWGKASFSILAFMAAGCAVESPDATSDGSSLSGMTHSALSTADVDFTGGEILGRPTDRSVALKAIANLGVEIYLEFGTSPGQYTGTTTPTSFGDGLVDATIGGLNSNTRYYYRMRYRLSGTSGAFVPRGEHSFQTQRARGSSYSFAIQSDSHQGYAAFYSDALYGTTMQNVANDRPDFIIDLGDTFSLDDNVETETSVRAKYLAQRTFFAMAGASSPVFLVLGNHENEEGWNLDDEGSNLAASLPVLGANARKRYFANPVPDAFYTGNDEPLAQIEGDHLRGDYYAFEWGDALFVAIDPFWYTMTKPFAGTTGGEKNDESVGNRWDWTIGRKQYLWLKQTLETSSAPYKFVFAHHVAGGSSDYVRAGALGAKYCEWGGYNTDGRTWGFGANRPGWEMPIHQLFVQNGVTAFFHGHDHVYAQEVLDGVIYQSCPHAANDDYGYGFATNQVDYAGSTMVANSGYLRVSVTPAATNVEYVRSYLSGDGPNGSVAHSYIMTSCSHQDTDGDGTNDCDDECPADPNKVIPGACGCGITDSDANGNGIVDCLETCTTDCSCNAVTIGSNDADSVAPLGTTVRWTANATCSGGTPMYQFRVRPPGSMFWRVVRAWNGSPSFDWTTAGLTAGTYRIQVMVRESASQAQFQSQAVANFTLRRIR